MKTSEMLEKFQEIAFKTFHNAFTNKQTSHAYLISGTKGTPLKETALFLAQSFVCEEANPLACEECITCIRLKNGSYTDFEFINPEGGNINKEAIEKLQESFSRTAMETKGKKIYIIHLIENANTVAVNRLLKFLEEPSDDIIGILTTENIAKVLPTITSRCQLIRLKGLDKDRLIEELIEDGIGEVDAKILSTFNNSKEEVLELLENTSYNEIKDLAYESFTKLFTEPYNLHYFIQTEITPMLNNKNDYSLYLELLQIYLKEMLWGRLDGYLEGDFVPNESVVKCIDIADAVVCVMLAQGKLDYNVNGQLLLDQLFYDILKKGGLL